MPKISAIKTQKKHPERCSIYLDGNYAFSLTRDQLAEFGLVVGQEVAQTELEKYRNDSAYGKLRDSFLRWLAIRWRSEYEILTYLKRKTEDELLQERVYDFATEHGYVDDEKFANMWAEYRVRSKPISRRRLQAELRQKRIDQAIISNVLDDLEHSDQAALRKLVERKRNRYPDQEKLKAYLARQGYNYEDIRQVLGE
jgi:regulatory protein